jgi:hypothetical protein
MHRRFQLRAIPLTLQPFSSSSSGEACEKYQFQHRMIHRGENYKDLAYYVSCAYVSRKYLQCFGPENWVQFLRIYVQFLVFFSFFKMDFLLKNIFLRLFIAASLLALMNVLIGMVKFSRTSSILCLLSLYFLRWNI